MENSSDFAGFDGLEYLDANGHMYIAMKAVITAKCVKDLADMVL